MAVIVLMGGESVVVDGSAAEVLERISRADGGYCELEINAETVHLNPASVAYVKDGDVLDPVRDTPGPQD